eukprot:SAG31_NODE_28109_length_415_cov_0.958861_1_plen_52_part_10
MAIVPATVPTRGRPRKPKALDLDDEAPLYQRTFTKTLDSIYDSAGEFRSVEQ